ncbi:MAG: class I SAM-dependent methyltransferase [Bryobacterales bacterium]|nr:class I SAM-dependent methyltransferase [Bryobacteraceae bacterium]MDW8130753.1 class I SAM-dependent methyltransferase [Bryobacterales bacterium]
MFRDRAKSPPRHGPEQQPVPGRGGRLTPAQVYSRHSHGLEEFFQSLGSQPGLNVLDWAGVSQANVDFITGRGNRLYSEDFYRLLEMHFGPGDWYASQQDPARVESFLDAVLGFPSACFDAALLWDMLEYLAPPLLEAVLARLNDAVKPGGYLLAIFHADEKIERVPVYQYRIAGPDTLWLSLRAMRAPAKLFNNRDIEKLFRHARALKFFLTRDHLREVIVRR